jgi:hypothetical protein
VGRWLGEAQKTTQSRSHRSNVNTQRTAATAAVSKARKTYLQKYVLPRFPAQSQWRGTVPTAHLPPLKDPQSVCASARRIYFVQFPCRNRGANEAMCSACEGVSEPRRLHAWTTVRCTVVNCV